MATLIETSKNRAGATILWIVYWVCLFGLTHTPVTPRGPKLIPNADKIAHFAAFFILGWLGMRAGIAARKRLFARSGILWLFLYACYAGADELTQPMMHRCASWGDWYADIIGIAAALGLGTFIMRFKENIGTSSNRCG